MPSSTTQPTNTEPVWRPVQRCTSAVVSASTRRWLLDDGSLTKRLMSGAQGTFKVQRLSQVWAVPQPSERQLLGMQQRQIALIREVSLQIHAQTVVFARSVFPLASLQGDLGHLRRLQNQSLGAILFSHPGMRRAPFELTRLEGNDRYLPSYLHQSNPAWGRRSRFEINGQPLMVSEVFLEHFRPWQATLPYHRRARHHTSAAIGNATA